MCRAPAGVGADGSSGAQTRAPVLARCPPSADTVNVRRNQKGLNPRGHERGTRPREPLTEPAPPVTPCRRGLQGSKGPPGPQASPEPVTSLAGDNAADGTAASRLPKPRATETRPRREEPGTSARQEAWTGTHRPPAPGPAPGTVGLRHGRLRHLGAAPPLAGPGAAPARPAAGDGRGRPGVVRGSSGSVGNGVGRGPEDGGARAVSKTTARQPAAAAPRDCPSAQAHQAQSPPGDAREHAARGGAGRGRGRGGADEVKNSLPLGNLGSLRQNKFLLINLE